MKLLLVSLLVVALGVAGCSSGASMGGSDLMGMVTKSLRLSEAQAMAGLGSLLSLGKEKLPADTFDKIGKAIPGVDGMLKAAADAGGITGPIGDLAGLSGQLSKLGISTDQVTRMVPALTDAVGKSAGSDVGSALAGVLK